MKTWFLLKRTTEPFTAREYAVFLALYWLYTLVWLAVTSIILAVWNVPALPKVFVMLLWLTFAPAGGQFQSYQSYLQWHEKHAVKRESTERINSPHQG